MKKILCCIILIIAFSSCSLFHKNNKNGCPTNGRNVDAGKLSVEDPQAKKDAKKAGKFKATKQFEQ